MLVRHWLFHRHCCNCRCISMGPKLLVIHTEFISCLLLSSVLGHIVAGMDKIVQQPVPDKVYQLVAWLLSWCFCLLVEVHEKFQFPNVLFPSHCLEWFYPLAFTSTASNYLQGYEVPTSLLGTPLSCVTRHYPCRSTHTYSGFADQDLWCCLHHLPAQNLVV